MFSFRSKEKQKLNAATLAEVLVVLAISATTLITIAQLTVQLLVTVKNNEIFDYTTGIAIQALEVAKSPDDIILTSAQPIFNVEGNYSIDLESNPARLYKQSDIVGAAEGKITECAADSPYFIEVDIAEAIGGANPNVCMQVIIKDGTNRLNQDYYEIETVTIAQLGTEKRVNNIIGYRRGEFDVQRQ